MSQSNFQSYGNRFELWLKFLFLGGSSQLNAMCYIRGHPTDYDRWAEKTGDEKFKYENVLPIFKESDIN